MGDELGDVLAEQAERRVGDDDVGLLEKRYAFVVSEVAIARLVAFGGVRVVAQQRLDVAQTDGAVSIEVGYCP